MLMMLMLMRLVLVRLTVMKFILVRLMMEELMLAEPVLVKVETDASASGARCSEVTVRRLCKACEAFRRSGYRATG